ncbi:MAG TPA: ATP-dependent Clp protease ATP-binding subunit [Paludibacteraceae bacterium]|nr:ATP-dependent Clp protease ATP-binding subunit [Paludibacteraceae bacterium]
MDFLNLNENLQISIRIAKSLAREYGNAKYTSAHLLKALLHKEVGLAPFVESMGKEVAYLEEWAEIHIEECEKLSGVADVEADERIKSLFEEADNVRLKLGLLEINPICVLCAMAKPEVAFTADQLNSFPVREKEILNIYYESDKTKQTASLMSESLPMGKDMISSQTNLMKYCVNKTQEARDGKLHPVVCRDKEIRQMMVILGRKSKPNVMITGDSGVGKTAIVEGLAFDIVNGNVPSFLEETVLWELDSGALIAGATYKGEIEDRLKNIIKELKQQERVILFVDEIHVLLDPKQGNTGAVNVLKPELAKGELTVIGATTVDEYRKLVEPDHAFDRRFEVLQIAEPRFDDAVNMVTFVMDSYKMYHHLEVDEVALTESVRLAKRYIKDRRLPDSAIDLMDRTMSAVKMVNETTGVEASWLSQELDKLETQRGDWTDDEFAAKLNLLKLELQGRMNPIIQCELGDALSAEFSDSSQLLDHLHHLTFQLEELSKQKIEVVTSEHIAAVVANATGIPIGKIQAGEKDRLLNMEEILRNRVVGQDRALKSLTDAILESRSGMNKPGQPIGSFFFLGPTGTGKTELTKALAEALFNDEKAMIRFDMSEFKEEHSAALLYGAPPGYVGYEEGGLLVNKIRQQPYAVVLFDEIEKAHPSVFDIFLQIMDEGKLHDRLGKEGDFSNAIIIFTSNVGSEWISKEISEGRVPTTVQMMEMMGRYFRPEFLARLSEIVPFAPIGQSILMQIFEIQFRGFRNLLRNREMDMELTDDAKHMLAFKGFTPQYGARQISGIIRNYLRRPVSKMILAELAQEGDVIKGRLDETGELVLEVGV